MDDNFNKIFIKMKILQIKTGGLLRPSIDSCGNKMWLPVSLNFPKTMDVL